MLFLHVYFNRRTFLIISEKSVRIPKSSSQSNIFWNSLWITPLTDLGKSWESIIIDITICSTLNNQRQYRIVVRFFNSFQKYQLTLFSTRWRLSWAGRTGQAKVKTNNTGKKSKKIKLFPEIRELCLTGSKGSNLKYVVSELKYHSSPYKDI